MICPPDRVAALAVVCIVAPGSFVCSFLSFFMFLFLCMFFWLFFGFPLSPSTLLPSFQNVLADLCYSIERYMVIILFNAYVTEQKPKHFGESFSEWMLGRPIYTRILAWLVRVYGIPISLYLFLSHPVSIQLSSVHR